MTNTILKDHGDGVIIKSRKHINTLLNKRKEKKNYLLTFNFEVYSHCIHVIERQQIDRKKIVINRGDIIVDRNSIGSHTRGIEERGWRNTYN